MSRNEVMGKAKLLMQKNLSHGAPSPKLSKMLEILIDHFKTKDPTKSRVIIFSNFRGSVRDIMDALINVGDFVKATQFVGQSSGKAFKGQSQKSQQAVLEKFRAGGYNVIVATSIGEEGLDIMEVDLVICFDANISPLRMIQRMGRTGRKHDGRVVVLACKGSELKGYMRKQASGKAIKKHMKNGGITSFNFHSSPRMIPHIFRPEVQFIELSIEQFVPRGKKVKNKMKDHLSVQTPKFDSNLTATETDLLAKYFHPSKNGSWRPSLIAFPYFQAFPSRVYKVTHSLRTEMLINSVQFLQGLSSTWHSKTFFLENEPQSGIGLQIETADEHNYSMRDLQSSHNSPEEHLLREVSDYDPLPVETSATEEKCYSSDSHIKKPVVLLSCLKQESFQSENLAEDCKVVTARKDSSDQTSQKSFGRNRKMLTSKLCNTDALKENMLDGAEEIQQTSVSKLLIADSTDETINENKAELLIADDAEEVQQTSVSKGKMLNERDSTDEAINENRAEVLIADDSSNALRDIELSPRLTNFIQRGVVPESPIEYSGGPEGRGKLVFTDIGSPGKSPTGGLQEHSVPEQNEKMVEYSNASGQEISASSPKEIFQTPLLNMKCSTTKGNISPFSIFEVKTPLSNATNDSCSKNWQLTSGGKSESVQQVKKFKRLRKYVDQVKWKLSERKEENFGPTTSLIRTFGSPSHILCNNGRGRRKLVRNVKAFIEEEAEVSSEVEVSDDENDEQDDNSYDDSFIDDRMDLTVASTQAEASRTDMMAIYRRSLLSQSPMNRLPSCSSDCSPNSVASNIQTGESGSSLEMVNCALHTKIDSESAGRISNSSGYKYRSVSEGMSGTINGIPRGNDYNLGARKRKLSFHPPGSVPAINLDEEFLSPSEVAAKETNLQDQAEKIQLHGDVFDDDQFYESLDLDAVEEQAAKILGHKSELAEKLMIPDPTCQQLDDLGSPSFDLGI
ncbi:RNA helicase [Bertholletia excelsa]